MSSLAPHIEAFLREQDTVVPRLGCVRRELLLESILFGAREISRRSRLIRVGAQPLGREIPKKVRNGASRPWRFALRRQTNNEGRDDGNDRKGFHG